jgi:uncharacterized protein YkwD
MRKTILTIAAALTLGLATLTAGSALAQTHQPAQTQALAKINALRAQHGAQSLSQNPALVEVARRHSLDMAQRGYFSHTNLEGLSPQGRVEKAGLKGYSCGENILWFSGGSRDTEHVAQKVYDMWLNSSGHRENFLRGTYNTGGLAIEEVGSRVYATHLLCRGQGPASSSPSQPVTKPTVAPAPTATPAPKVTNTPSQPRLSRNDCYWASYALERLDDLGFDVPRAPRCR